MGASEECQRRLESSPRAGPVAATPNKKSRGSRDRKWGRNRLPDRACDVGQDNRMFSGLT